MSLPLLRKEAREHGPVLAATAVIGLVALFTILGVAEDAGGRFVGLARFLLTMGPLIAPPTAPSGRNSWITSAPSICRLPSASICRNISRAARAVGHRCPRTFAIKEIAC